MTLLNQIVAVEKGVKSRVDKRITAAYHTLQKSQLFTGLSRVYTPRDDDGATLPPESTRVQTTVSDQLGAMAADFTELFDVVLTKETSNAQAKADVVVHGQTLLADVPVTYLLFLEKQLTHWHTALAKVPVLTAEDEWTEDPSNDGWYRTPAVQTIKTKKVPRNHVMAPATERHPAQVEVYYEDIPVGTWATVKFSGAITAKRRDEYVARVDALLDAVKQAREAANSLEVQQKKAGEALFSYLLA